MGCDIHEFLELKIRGRWIYVGRISVGRNYGLFAVLAGVRNNGSVRCVTGGPRCIPEDCDPTLKILSDDYGDDGHSHSYLYLNELAEAKKIYVERFGNEEYWPECLTNLNDLLNIKGVEDVRFVFWFDN